MGHDYALVHLKYTIPPAIALTICYKPLHTDLGLYKILFLISIAVISTTPWDSYLIHSRIWTYPPNAIIGPTIFRIPVEEVFFFIIQTYNTSLLYLLLSKPTFHPVYLRGRKLLNDGRRLRLWRWLGISLVAAILVAGMHLVLQKREGLYLGLILVWAGPFVLLLWSLAYQFIMELPLSNTILPIAIPTIYLWVVDTLALKRGTWVIESGTKLGWQLWDGLDIEEAIFFLVTNILVVFGLIAFDNAFAILQTSPQLFHKVPELPSPLLLVQALLVPTSRYEDDRIDGLQQALTRLRAKSRSFYLASGFFQGRLRIDLILLYSFCRIADDLVDDAASVEEARHWISCLEEYLDVCYGRHARLKAKQVTTFVNATFPTSTQLTLKLLPTAYLSPQPLYDLLEGFATDLNFTSSNQPFPIKDELTLQKYGAQVAGTVAELCLELVFYHTTTQVPEVQKQRIVRAGGRMGIALQYINIARDISVDAANQRVYLPTSWLIDVDLKPIDVKQNPHQAKVEQVRQRLLDAAFDIYNEAKGAIEELPADTRGPMRVAVESYVEIGRVLRKPGFRVKAGRATVPKLRRIKVAWNALNKS